jgi:hypothetical protein
MHGREGLSTYIYLVGEFGGKGPLCSPRRRRNNSIKMDLREIEYKRVYWIQLNKDRFPSTTTAILSKHMLRVGRIARSDDPYSCAGRGRKLAGSPKPDSSKGRSQTKCSPLVLQVRGWAWC